MLKIAKAVTRGAEDGLTDDDLVKIIAEATGLAPAARAVHVILRAFKDPSTRGSFQEDTARPDIYFPRPKPDGQIHSLVPDDILEATPMGMIANLPINEENFRKFIREQEPSQNIEDRRGEPDPTLERIEKYSKLVNDYRDGNISYKKYGEEMEKLFHGSASKWINFRDRLETLYEQYILQTHSGTLAKDAGVNDIK